MNSFKQALTIKENTMRSVEELFLERLEAAQQQAAGDFLKLFNEHLYIEDWLSKEPSDIAGCLFCLWMALNQNSDEVYVRAFNPSLEEDGWLCSGTAFIVRQRDMPFLVDSLRLGLVRHNLPIHLIKSTLLNVARNQEHELLGIAPINADSTTDIAGAQWQQEALIYIETGAISDRDVLKSAASDLRSILSDVTCVVDDYRPILARVEELKENLEFSQDQQHRQECQAFLSWLAASHFTFLGIREYRVKNQDAGIELEEDQVRRLGLFRNHHRDGDVHGADFFYRGENLVALSKSAHRSTVHRNVYPDYIVVKQFSEQGELLGEIRILGLFTFSVYSISPWDIPIIRRKVDEVIERSGLSPVSHDGKNLKRVIESYPRDELFQADVKTLYETLMGVARISERRLVKLFLRKDIFGKFLNCVVYVPRDIYNTQIRQKIEKLIGQSIASSEFDTTTHFSESLLARAHMVFKLPQDGNGNIEQEKFDQETLERAVIDITRGWDDRFEAALIEAHGESLGLEYQRMYATSFGSSYRENFDARASVKDIELLENLKGEHDVAMQLFHPIGAENGRIRFKVMQLDAPVELSDVIPILEHLGLRVLGEHPYKIMRADQRAVWLHDFDLVFSLPVKIDVQVVSKLFEQAFAAIWQAHTESDAFNRLVLGARLNWREVGMLRAYSAYMKQILFNYSPQYIAETLSGQPEITRNLVALFKSYFEPRLSGTAKARERSERLREKITLALEGIENLNEDRILRRYLELINATVRTNYYQKQQDNSHKNYLSFKLTPRKIEDLPEPRPMFEIFVYSPQIEGVHLRAAEVARGGLRWSDRLQDYRTEVLGLVKAQQVKNAVIVPSGAKGGFVAKANLSGLSRDEFLAEGVSCYKTFIKGLLDLTDNYREGQLQSPEDCVCRDEPDPYLVVAADKGTATFSDIANEISGQYGHWLGDAFASGGSNGYDHKKMGITAKGAWVSVQRHFREIGIDCQSQEFSVVGIGDMSGDVFGNGMLLSRKIKLVAAFNHQHIFIDPNPEPETSFVERERLFALPRSGWGDYDTAKLSEGGAIFSRFAKAIEVSEQAVQALGLEKSKFSPPELIQAILKAPVDLLWNGGIGTYVKSKQESHSDAGDKSNDALRVDGRQLRCKIVGEGGNLGLTQRGRIEFCRNGGACNTDFIDNSAGVDCSDHEVNIKILLDELIASGDLTQKQRNQTLEKMTDEVAELVLDNNDAQTFALSIAQFQVNSRLTEYKRFIGFLEGRNLLDRALEFLPTDEEIQERAEAGGALTRAELAVLLSYSKVMLKEEFIRHELVDIDYLKKIAVNAFPKHLREQHLEKIYEHRLVKEIVATQLANDLVNNLGITAAQRLIGSTGRSLKDIALAYAIVREVFAVAQFQDYINSLNNKVAAQFQAELMCNMMRRLRRGTRWFLTNKVNIDDPQRVAESFKQGIVEVNACVGEMLRGEAKITWQLKCEHLRERGVDELWLSQIAMPENLFSGLSVVEVAQTKGCPVSQAAEIFYHLYDSLSIEWLATQISDVAVQTHWQAIARESYLSELETQLRNLVCIVIEQGGDGATEQKLSCWHEQNKDKVDFWLNFVREVRTSKSSDFAMFSVVLKELSELAK